MRDYERRNRGHDHHGSKYRCSLCNEEKGEFQFTLSGWKQRLQAKSVLCLDCCRPRCISKRCRTCAVCRDPTCRKRKCKNSIMPLHFKHRLKRKEDLATYLCARCRWITCACGKTMPQRTERRQKRAGTFLKLNYRCEDCSRKHL